MHFIKAQGLGNDFVMLLNPELSFDYLSEFSQILADRRYGVGCDQVVVAFKKNGNYSMHFFNPDGSEAESCGNGSRCMAKYIMQKNNIDKVRITTLGGELDCSLEPSGMVSVVMPEPKVEILGGASALGHLSTPDAVSVNVGNPHLVCFVKNVNVAEQYGAGLENHPKFPMRANVNFVKVNDLQYIELKVWERGTGVTPACGSGACASVVAAYTHSLVGEKVQVKQQGGDLWISYNGSKLIMTGPAEIVFVGDYKK